MGATAYRAQLLLACRLLNDGLRFVFSYMRGNRLRTFLSLLGITIGIFTIVALLVVVYSLQSYITNEISQFGDNTVYVQKWAWGGRGEYPWWVYASFPEPDYRDYQAIESNARQVATIGMSVFFSGVLRNRELTLDEADVAGLSKDLEGAFKVVIDKGRGFSASEYARGTNVCLLGSTLASQLFAGKNPVGHFITLKGYRTRVVGVVKEYGSSNFGNSPDERMFIPLQYARKFVDFRHASTLIAATGKPGVPGEEVNDDIRRVLRASRRLSPTANDNFTLNRVDKLSDELGSLFSILTTAGWVIGAFSILIGGFGIANIMFVSVKERTRIIGIQKSLGAKKWFILFQYLFESIFLSVIGGMIGIGLVVLVAVLVNLGSSFVIAVGPQHVLIGLLLSAVIGTISGYIPAQQAASLDPVIAISTTV